MEALQPHLKRDAQDGGVVAGSTRRDIEKRSGKPVVTGENFAFIKIIDPVKAVYGISNYEYAIQNLVMTSLRAIIGEMELDRVLSSRDIIKARLKDII